MSPQQTSPTQTSNQPKPRLRPARTPGCYVVESRTRPGRAYLADTRRLTCTCEAASFGRRCWHITTAIGFHEWRKRQQQPTPQAPAVLAAPQQTMPPVALSSYFE